MPYLTGQSGSIYYSEAESAADNSLSRLLKVRNWSLDIKVNTSQTTALGDAAETAVPTLRGASGSCQLFYYTKTVGETGSTAADIIQSLVRIGAPSDSDRLCMKLNLDATRYVKLNAWITGVQLGQTTGEVSSASVSFTMDGDFLAVVL